MNDQERKHRESPRSLRKRASSIISILHKTYPDASGSLRHASALDLLIATILSAQCTDARVNSVTKELFKKYRTPHDYGTADRATLEQEIRSTGFYRAKAKNIISSCAMIVATYNGKVPETMDELLRLPGVGRKTANVLLSNFFGKAEGIVVDTHVRRLSVRMGLSKQTNPEKIERDLISLLPKNDWMSTGNLFIRHGRTTCHARRPKCRECPLYDLCPSPRQSGSLPVDP